VFVHAVQKVSLFFKALVSSALGLPVAYLINISILPLLNGLIHENVFLASALLASVFFIFSFLRIYFLDLIYQKYKVRPLELIKKRLGS